MPTAPRKRWLLIPTGVTGLMVLFVIYVLSFGLMTWGFGNGWLSDETMVMLERGPYFPIRWYMSEELPGWQMLTRYVYFCLDNGLGSRQQ